MLLLRESLDKIRHYHLDDLKENWLDNLRHADLQRVLNCSRSRINSMYNSLVINIALIKCLNLSPFDKTLVHFKSWISPSEMLDHRIDIFQLLVSVPSFLLRDSQKWIVFDYYQVNVNLIQFRHHVL